MKTVLIAGLLGTLALSNAVSAQDQSASVFAPDSEIHLFDLGIKEGQYALRNGRNISNSPDYDNQPYFTPDGTSILFSSSRDRRQTDIYEYLIASGQIRQITNTDENEFSPKPVGRSGNISFVTEGRNPYNTVWQLDRETGGYKWLLNSHEPVGYYHLNQKTGGVLFWSRFGWSVQYLNPERNINRFVSGNALPSSPQKIPGSSEFSFVHRQTNSAVWIKAFDPADFSIRPVAPISGSNYDYGWTPDGDILRLEGNKLYVWSRGNPDLRWTEVQDLSDQFSGTLGRLAVSHDGKYIAVVETK